MRSVYWRILFLCIICSSFPHLGYSNPTVEYKAQWELFFQNINSGQDKVYMIADILVGDPGGELVVKNWDSYKPSFLIQSSNMQNLKMFGKDNGLTCSINGYKVMCEAAVGDIFDADGLKQGVPDKLIRLNFYGDNDVGQHSPMDLANAEKYFLILKWPLTNEVPEITYQPVAIGLTDRDIIERRGLDEDLIRTLFCFQNPDKCAVNCEEEPDADECDKDADGIINKDDSCKDKAEAYATDGETPVDGVLDGCPTETGGPDPVDPDENLPAQMSEGGACTLVKSEAGFGLAFFIFLSMIILPISAMRLSAVLSERKRR